MGVKSLVYFEIVTTLALFIGLAAINISQARALMCEPMMRALRKYSSLWMMTRNASEASATYTVWLRLTVTITMFDIMLPMMGIRPKTKVRVIIILTKGSLIPAYGRIAARYMAVKKAFMPAIRSWM